MIKNWYAIHTYSGYENKVKSTIEHMVQLEGLRDKVGDILIPSKKFVEIKNGKKHDVMRNIMPGYVLIEMEEDEEIFSIVQKIQGVSGFLGDGTKPCPMPEEEVNNLRDTIDERSDRQKSVIHYRITDQVKVIEGPFANFIGTVEHVDHEKGKLKVMVSIFGRPTSVELDVLQVENV
jgi:transcription termination/antitermination protein NusG